MEESWRDTDPNVERGNLIRQNKAANAYMDHCHEILNKAVRVEHHTLAIAAGVTSLRIREIEEENKQVRKKLSALIKENRKLREDLEKRRNIPCPVCGELPCEDSQKHAEAEWQRMEAENIRLKETLKKIDDFRKLSSVDMADPLEQQLYDWQVACKRCWDVAQQALEPNKPRKGREEN